MPGWLPCQKHNACTCARNFVKSAADILTRVSVFNHEKRESIVLGSHSLGNLQILRANAARVFGSFKREAASSGFTTRSPSMSSASTTVASLQRLSWDAEP